MVALLQYSTQHIQALMYCTGECSNVGVVVVERRLLPRSFYVKILYYEEHTSSLVTILRINTAVGVG